MKHPKLRCCSKAGTLAVKLAKDAFFGEDVMAQCMVDGEHELPGLPAKELQQLKNALFMQFPDYRKVPQEFEPLWKDATQWRRNHGCAGSWHTPMESSEGSLVPIHHHSNQYGKSYFPSTINAWNSLPSSIQSSMSIIATL